MSVRKRVCAALTALTALVSAAAPAPTMAQDGGMWSINIAGYDLNCRDSYGTPVRIYVRGDLQNVGIATRMQGGQPIIVLNPYVMSSFGPTVQVWWFAHECGHHVVGLNETAADCWGIRVMRDQGILRSYAQLDEFAYELANLPGSPVGHLPGPDRARAIAYCAMT